MENFLTKDNEHLFLDSSDAACRQCEIQSQKYNVGELPNVKRFADVSSEGPSSERLLRVCAKNIRMTIIYTRGVSNIIANRV